MSKILVIDDEEWLREMIRLALEQQNYEVLEAASGGEGASGVLNGPLVIGQGELHGRGVSARRGRCQSRKACAAHRQGPKRAT